MQCAEGRCEGDRPCRALPLPRVACVHRNALVNGAVLLTVLER